MTAKNNADSKKAESPGRIKTGASLRYSDTSGSADYVPEVKRRYLPSAVNGKQLR